LGELGLTEDEEAAIVAFTLSFRIFRDAAAYPVLKHL
jgi:hypothetical protein